MIFFFPCYCMLFCAQSIQLSWFSYNHICFLCFQLQHQIHQQSVRNYAQLHLTQSQFTGHQTMNSLLYRMNFSTPFSPASPTLSVSLYAVLWWEYIVWGGTHDKNCERISLKDLKLLEGSATILKHYVVL